MLDEMNQKDKKYMPFLNGHGQEEWQTENLEKSSVENQEKVLQRILEGKYRCNLINNRRTFNVGIDGLAMKPYIPNKSLLQ